MKVESAAVPKKKLNSLLGVQRGNEKIKKNWRATNPQKG